MVKLTKRWYFINILINKTFIEKFGYFDEEKKLNNLILMKFCNERNLQLMIVFFFDEKHKFRNAKKTNQNNQKSLYSGFFESSGRWCNINSCLLSMANWCWAADEVPLPARAANCPGVGPPAKPGCGIAIGIVGGPGAPPPGNCWACICWRSRGRSRCCCKCRG